MHSPSRRYERYTAAALMLLLGLIIGLSLVFPPSGWLPLQRWGAALESAGAGGLLVFLLLATLATSVGLPRQLVAFTAGLAYGVMPGILLSLLAALGGCYLTVRVSQALLSQWVEHRFPAFIRKLDLLLRDDVFLKILILRFQPLGTNLITNVCIGFTAVPHRLFLFASGLGYLPQMGVFSLLGAGIRVGSQTQLILSMALMTLSIVLGIYLLRQHRLRELQSH
ncbi:MAG: hypothetical protein HKN42_03640 [Granulosicoccus sp.]|nr:hypothetical protein [Granulosicoccus sp.]